MSINTTTLDIFETLTNGKQIAQSLLTDLAQNQEKFKSIVEIAFGSDINSQKLDNLRQKWLAQDFSNLPEVEIRSASEIDGANGAFSGDTNRIYIAEEFIVANEMNLEAIADVFLEEIGHFVDSQINISDSPGDEGKIFASAVKGETLGTEKLSLLQTENDRATVNIENQFVHIEKSDPGVILDENGRGTKFKLDNIPIFTTDPEKDLDKDGLNDEWENIAVQSLKPTLSFHENEDLFSNEDHKVALFTRVTPVQAKDGNTYVLFMNTSAFTKDYGTPKAGIGGHNGDVSNFQTAWKVMDDDSIELDRLWTSGHVDRLKDIHHETFEIKVGNSNMEFAEDGSLKIYIEEDKHSNWPSIELRDLANGTYPVGSGTLLRPDTFNVGEPNYHPSSDFTNKIHFLFDEERVWFDDPNGLFCGGLKCDKAKKGKRLGGIIGSILGGISGGISEIIVENIIGTSISGGLIGTVSGGITGIVKGIEIGRKIDGASSKYIGSVFTDEKIDELFPNNTRKGSEFYLHLENPISAEVNLTIDRVISLDWDWYNTKGPGDGMGDGTAEFYAKISIGSGNDSFSKTTGVVNEKSNPQGIIIGSFPQDWSFNHQVKDTYDPLVPITIDIIDQDGPRKNRNDDHADINPSDTIEELVLDYNLFTGEVNNRATQEPLEKLNSGQFYSEGEDGTDKSGIWFTIEHSLAGITPESKLALNIGLEGISGGNPDEDILIKHISGQAGNEVIEIDPDNFKQTYGPGTGKGEFTVIQGFAGDGNDEIILDGVLTPVYMGGGNGNDRIEIINTPGGTAPRSTIFGDDGNDTLQTGAGNDGVYGGEGDDRLVSNDGDDHVTGGGNNDFIDGGNGDDILSGDSGNPGADTIYGGSGEDVIGGGGDTDTIDGGEGDDVILGDSSFDSVDEITLATPDTGAGDSILGGLGDDMVLGEWGDDEIHGNEGVDSLFAGPGNDIVYGGSDNDIIEGNDDADFLTGEQGEDVIDGGNDIDTVSYDNSPNAVVVNI
ncbi:hypothetical protein ACP6PL_15290, partial [Dapis sp. BLCC M126]